MATSLTSHLQALSTDDLAVLLGRRTDARRMLGLRRQDMAALADLLSSPTSIHWAALALDGFLSQLLALLIWLGPEVPADRLVEQVPGVSPERLRAGVDELARWGLAFVDGQLLGAGWAAFVPAATMAAVPPPEGLGPAARRLLEPKSIEFLTAVARNIGLESRPRSGKPALVAEIAVALSERPRIERLLEAAPPKAVDLFERVRRGGGTLTRHDLMLGEIIRWSDPPWSERRKVLTPLDWLEAHGLAVLDSTTAYSGAVTILGEVELALRGGQMFESWPPPDPPEFILRGGETAPTDVGDPSKVVAEMEVVLEAWAETRPPILQKGGLGVRELRKTAKALSLEEEYVSFLYALAAEAELIAVDLDGRVTPTSKRAEWAASPAPKRWAALFEAWLHSVLLAEDHDEAVLPVNEALPRLWAVELRRGIVQTLGQLRPGQVADAIKFTEYLFWRYPGLLGTPDNTARLTLKALKSLEWLGTHPGPPALKLLEPGRSAIADPAWYEHEGPALAAFPTAVATCTVGADLRIIVPGPPVPELADALGRFADLKASSPARIYELSEASLRRGLDGGMTAEAMVAALADHAPRGVPQNVAYLIEDIGRRYGHLIAGTAGLYLRSDDPALLRSAISDRRLAPFRARLIAPTVAVLEGTATEALLAQLRLAGYLPVAEDAGGRIQGRAPEPEHTVPVLPPMPKVRPLFPSEATALAELLTSGGRSVAAGLVGATQTNGKLPAPGPESAPDRHRRRGISEIRALLAEAVRQGLVLEICYLSKNGRRSERLIQPEELDATHIEAWCMTTDADQRFALARIEWARYTGWTVDTLDEFFHRIEQGESPAALLGEEEAELDRR